MPRLSADRETALRCACWALLAIVAAVPRFWGLASPPYDPDEVWEVTHNSASLVEQAHRVEGFPPLHGLVLGWWLAAVQHDLAARVLSAACGLATVVVAGQIGKHVGGAAVGWWSAVLLAVSPYHILFSRSARPYAFGVLLCSLAILAAVRLARGRRSFGAWAFFVTACWLTLSAGYLTSILVALLLGLLAYSLGRNRLRPLAWATLTLAVACLPLLYCFWIDVREINNDYFHVVVFDKEAYAYTYYLLLTGGALGPATDELRALSPNAGAMAIAPWAGAAFLAAGVLAVSALRTLSGKWRAWLTALVLAPPGLMALAALAVPSGYNHRYLSWVCVPFSVWLASGATFHARRPLRLAATVVLLGLAALSTVNLLSNPRYTGIDFARVRAVLDERFDSPAILSSPDYFAQAVAYHFDKETPVAMATGRPGETAELRQRNWAAAFRKIAEAPSDSPDFALVLQWMPEDDGRYPMQQELISLLSAEHVGQPSTGVSVYRGSRANLRAALQSLESQPEP